jgi:(4S)-4-hydroxy-5-phosphonooxypentane-2,3-dione isomerase
MFAVTVTFRIVHKQSAAFMPLMIENARASLALESGCHRFDVLTDPGRPDEVFLYELYEDRAAFDAHMQTEHFLQFNRASADMIEDKEVKTFSEVRT